MAAPDLFVVCRNCGSEVSPYVTECPYCGTRLRKRAPKIERPDPGPERARKRPSVPSLGRLRPGEIPGIRADRRPWATVALVAVSLLAPLVLAAGAFALSDVAIAGALEAGPWRVITAPFAYTNTGYEFAALIPLAVFGWLLERRHGPLVVLGVALLAGAGGMALAGLAPGGGLASGGNGMALGLLCAWVVPDLLARRGGEDVESDGLGVAAMAAVLLLLPLAVAQAHVLAGLGGATIGLLAGVVLMGPRRGSRRRR